MSIALIDADILIMQASYASEAKYYIYQEPGKEIIRPIENISVKANLKKWLDYKGILYKDEWFSQQVEYVEESALPIILQSCVDSLHERLKELGCKKFYLFVTAPNAKEHNFRFKIKSPFLYKGHRPPKPKYFPQIYNLYCQNAKAGKYDKGELIIREGYEADDVIAAYWNACVQKNKSCIIASRDKDMLQLHGNYLDIRTKELYEISERESYFNFWYQAITGDTSDNIPGVRHWVDHFYGEEVANKLSRSHYVKKSTALLEHLNSWQAMYSFVLGLYMENGLTEKHLDITCSLLYLVKSKHDTWEAYKKQQLYNSMDYLAA